MTTPRPMIPFTILLFGKAVIALSPFGSLCLLPVQHELLHMPALPAIHPLMFYPTLHVDMRTVDAQARTAASQPYHVLGPNGPSRPHAPASTQFMFASLSIPIISGKNRYRIA